MYDYGFRYYDPVIWRWNSLDPLPDSDHNLPLNPYHFVNNNPILYLDPNGLDWYVHDSTGALHWYNGNYEDNGLTNPEGYSFLGDNNYFGDDATTMIKEFTNGLIDLNSDDAGSWVTFTSDISEEFASEAGFEKLATQRTEIHQLDLFRTKHQYTESEYLIDEKFSYFEKGSIEWNYDGLSRDVSGREGPAMIIVNRVVVGYTNDRLKKAAMNFLKIYNLEPTINHGGTIKTTWEAIQNTDSKVIKNYIRDYGTH